MSPAECTHERIACVAGVTAIEDTGVKVLNLQATCADCGEPMVFLGLPISAIDGVPQIERGGRGAVLPVLPFSTVYPDVVAARAQLEQAREEAKRPQIEIIGGGRERVPRMPN